MKSFNFFRLVKVKWGKELYNEVDLNTDDEPVLFKAQLYALTGVQPHRQKVMVKGAVIKDESWDTVANKLKNGATLLLMGSKGIMMFQMNAYILCTYVSRPFTSITNLSFQRRIFPKKSLLQKELNSLKIWMKVNYNQQ